MLIKTRARLADAVVADVRARHPYETPAIVVLPVAGGSVPFLEWVAMQTSRNDGDQG